MKPITRNFILLVVCGFCFFANLGAFEPDLMEARNFVTAREILQNDQWLLPTMNGQPRLEKPPFPTWMSAVTSYLFGPSLFWLRFPAALMACLMVFFFYRLAKELFGSENEAWITTLIFTSCPMMIEMGRTGSWDIFCQAVMLGGVYHLYKGLQKQAGSLFNFLLAATFIGLSSMSKGPVAIYGMLFPFLISYFIAYGFQQLKGRRKEVILTFLVAIILSAWWYVYAKVEAPKVSAFVAEKEVEAWTNRHTQPFWFYISFPAFMGIWAIFVVAAFFYPYFRKRVTDSRQYLFVLLWVLISVFMLSLIPEKKERYLLPVIPPMAFLAGIILNSIRKSIPGNDKVVNRLFRVFGSLVIVALIAGTAGLYFVLFKQGYTNSLIVISCSLGFVFLAIRAFSYLKTTQVDKLIGTVVAAVVIFTMLILPALPEFNYKNPEFKDISEIRQAEWYNKYDFYTDYEVNLKAIWRIGKPVNLVKGKKPEWPANEFVLISENQPVKSLGKDLMKKAKITRLGEYDYYRKKSKFRLYIHKVEM